MRFAPGAILRQIGLAVLALTVLVGVQNAEAQLPDFDIYGIDTAHLYEYEGGQWYETLTTVNSVYVPGGSTKGVVSCRFAHPYQECISDSRTHAFFWAIDKK